jgi:O-antigen/teichoic acid export membrane protein
MSRFAEMRRMLASPLGRNTLLQMLAMAANSALGILVYGLLASALSVEDFGTYAFVVALFAFTGMFFDFGIAPAGMRLMAVENDTAAQRSMAGALLVLSSGVGLLYALCIAAASMLVDAWFHQGAGRVLLLAAPLAAMLPLYEMVLSMSQGGGNIRLLSLAIVLPRVLLVALLLVPGLVVADVSRAVLVTLIASGLTVLVVVTVLHPSLRGVRQAIRTVFGEVRAFGRDVYTGRVVDGLTTGLDKILLTKFHGPTPVAFYSIALTMAMPIGLFNRALAQSSYKSFTGMDAIPTRVLRGSAIWALGGGAAVALLGPALVPVFFPGAYNSALQVLPLLALGVALGALNSPYNAFLAAKRQGKAIRIMSISTSVTNIVLNLLLIPLWAMTGAAIAYIATYALNIGMNVYYYRRVRNIGAGETR